MNFDEFRKATNALIDEYRSQCFWHNRRDFYPETPEMMLRALDTIQRYGDLDGFRRAGALKQWLSQNSSAAFAR